MNMISRDERKKQKGIKKFLLSFTYPIKGLKYAYRNEQNLAVDVGIALIVLIAGFLFKISLSEWGVLALTIGMVISGELFNTAIDETMESQSKIIDNYLMMEFIGTDELDKKRELMNKVTKKEIVNVAKKVKIDTVFLLEGGK